MKKAEKQNQALFAKLEMHQDFILKCPTCHPKYIAMVNGGGGSGEKKKRSAEKKKRSAEKNIESNNTMNSKKRQINGPDSAVSSRAEKRRKSS